MLGIGSPRFVSIAPMRIRSSLSMRRDSTCFERGPLSAGGASATVRTSTPLPGTARHARRRACFRAVFTAAEVNTGVPAAACRSRVRPDFGTNLLVVKLEGLGDRIRELRYLLGLTLTQARRAALRRPARHDRSARRDRLDAASHPPGARNTTGASDRASARWRCCLIDASKILR